MQITDRAKDVVKSGGEWISSIEIENIAMGHDAVANAAFVGIAHPKWDERQLLLCHLQDAASESADELKPYLARKSARSGKTDYVQVMEPTPPRPTDQEQSNAKQQQNRPRGNKAGKTISKQ